MKKLLLILLLFSASTFAQLTKIPGQIPGDDNYKTGAVILMLNPDSTFSPVNSDNPIYTTTVYGYVNKTLSFTDTTNKTMVRDTVSRKWSNTTNSLGVIYSKWIKFTVTAIDDTILFSSDPTFPSNKSTTLYPGESFTSEKRDVYYFLNFYYKVKGWGIATVRWIIEGV